MGEQGAHAWAVDARILTPPILQQNAGAHQAVDRLVGIGQELFGFQHFILFWFDCHLFIDTPSRFGSRPPPQLIDGGRCGFKGLPRSRGAVPSVARAGAGDSDVKVWADGRAWAAAPG